MSKMETSNFIESQNIKALKEKKQGTLLSKLSRELRQN